MTKPFTKPSDYLVVCTVAAHTQGGHHFEQRTHRVGPAKDLAGAKALIKEDLRAMNCPNTFGGLIDWGPVAPRSYRVFKAIWEEIEIPQSRRK